MQLDPATEEKFREFLQRPAHPTGGGHQVLQIKQPAFPQYRFEWHPQKRKVYLIRMGHFDRDGQFVPKPPGSTLHAEVLSEYAETEGHAFNAVQTFLRGFHEGRTPDLTKPHLEG